MIKVTDVAYVRFQAPDLDRMRHFLADFGMRPAEDLSDGILRMRGLGPAPFIHQTVAGEPAFLGFGLYARSLEDLDELAGSEGCAVQDLKAPGGGKFIRLQAPDGFEVDIIAGQTPAAAIDSKPEEMEWNVAGRPRRLRSAKRVPSGPAHVVRLGHVVFLVSDFARMEDWLKGRLGFLTSDTIIDPEGKPVASFIRCDRGDQETDHHTLNFAVAASGPPRFHHAAFEVKNFDDLMAGNQFMHARGHRQKWGIGRHVLGSQVFNYWEDPWGQIVEHWTDGDLFTASDGAQTCDLGVMTGVQWGPEMVPGFV